MIAPVAVIGSGLVAGGFATWLAFAGLIIWAAS
jgi:hypothetical protein